MFPFFTLFLPRFTRFFWIFEPRFGEFQQVDGVYEIFASATSFRDDLLDFEGGLTRTAGPQKTVNFVKDAAIKEAKIQYKSGKVSLSFVF